MPFVHEDSDSFAELIERVADQLNRDRFTVEKDYWVTHALYALQAAGFSLDACTSRIRAWIDREVR